MCDPISIALLAGGAGLNYLGNEQAKEASNSALQAERQRQALMTQQQQQALDQSDADIKKLSNPQEQQAAVDKRKAAFIEALNTAPASQGYLPGQDNAPAVVASAADKTNAAQADFSRQQAAALAALTGNSDQMLNTNIALGRNGQIIGQLGKNKANSAAALEAELRAAQFKGQTLRGLGQLGMTAGGALAGAGLLAPAASAGVGAAGTAGAIGAGSAATGAATGAAKIASLFPVI